jgi:hypothetical protein
MDRIIKMLCLNICNVWHKVRCRTFRRVDDFNYHVFLLDKKTSPYFDKVIETDNDYEKTICLKIGGVAVRYSLDKLVRSGEIQPDLNSEWLVTKALINRTIKSHKTADVIQLKGRCDERRKRNNI